jgi:GNAT superfamily N-acetyltransferase
VTGTRIERWDPSDGETLRGFVEVRQAVHAVDDPLGPTKSARVLDGWLRAGWIGDPGEAWFVPGPEPGSVVAWYRLGLPDLENRDRAALAILVHPECRRQGIGRALLRHAAERAAAAGRVTLDGEVRDGLAGDTFAAWAGATYGGAETMRVLELRAAPAGKFAELRAAAARAAAGYSLVSWTGPTPDEYLEPMATVINAFGDAPRDAAIEAQTWDGRRLRERGDAVLEILGVRAYTVGAVHEATGTLAAMTQLNVDPEYPAWGHQALTAVTRAHRGHRLGLLVKSAMLEWLATAEPQLERIVTGNAAVNQHMIAINEQLGYELMEPSAQSWEIAVADLYRLPADR